MMNCGWISRNMLSDEIQPIEGMTPVIWDRREEGDRRLLCLGKERLAGTNLANGQRAMFIG
jgi:hypothetical protein